MNKIIPLHSLHLSELQKQAYYFTVSFSTLEGVFVFSPHLAFSTLVPQNLDTGGAQSQGAFSVAKARCCSANCSIALPPPDEYLGSPHLLFHVAIGPFPLLGGMPAACGLVNDNQVQPSKLDLMPVLQYWHHQNRKEKSRKTCPLSSWEVKLPIGTEARRHVNTKRQTKHLTSTHLIQFGACVVVLRLALCQLQGNTCPDMQLLLPKEKSAQI